MPLAIYLHTILMALHSRFIREMGIIIIRMVNDDIVAGCRLNCAAVMVVATVQPVIVDESVPYNGWPN